MRDRLIELLDIIIQPGEKTLGDIADHLLASGIIVQEWISVDDRLPVGADGKSTAEDVIAYLNNGDVTAQVCTGWLNGDRWWLVVGDDDHHTEYGGNAVTHWMPLPKPPKGE